MTKNRDTKIDDLFEMTVAVEVAMTVEEVVMTGEIDVTIEAEVAIVVTTVETNGTIAIGIEAAHPDEIVTIDMVVATIAAGVAAMTDGMIGVTTEVAVETCVVTVAE